jgi:hypothetical protein
LPPGAPPLPSPASPSSGAGRAGTSSSSLALVERLLPVGRAATAPSPRTTCSSAR